jgi:iron complex transport system substrate-binding protein
MRIVSLIASATEIICALGFEKQLVGRSHECDFPGAITSLPACSASKIDVNATSIEIDRQVKKIVQESLSVYHVNVEKLKELNPDVIITQDQCEVCAVSLKDVEQAVCDWMGTSPKIVSLRPNDLNDVWLTIRQVARALNIPEAGDEVVDQLCHRIHKIEADAKWLNCTFSVACIEWFDPLMAAGNWVPEFVSMLGCQDHFAMPGKHAPWMTWERLREVDPDYIVTMPCGWNISRSLEEIGCLVNQIGWQDLKAVKDNHVYLTDGNHFFNRPSPRLVESLEILAEIIHPESFDFGHQKSWQVL